MDYQTIYSACCDENFQNRCRVAMWRAAQDIASEDPETEGHTMRKDWAERVLRENVNISGRQLAMQVLRNPQIAANPTSAPDADIQYQVNSVIDYIRAIG